MAGVINRPPPPIHNALFLIPSGIGLKECIKNQNKFSLTLYIILHYRI